MKKTHEVCWLCKSENKLLPITAIDQRSYRFCKNCYLISTEKKDLLSIEQEKQRYLTHQNSIEFEGYVNFLKQVITPALNYITKEMIGLDYGCGHTPTLSKILNNDGYLCEDYDPLFVNNNLDKRYDYIFCTEAFEHFHDPYKEIKQIHSLLHEEGILAFMTERWIDLDQFSSWYYLRDNTHVCFYHDKTFSYICNKFGFKQLFDDEKRVIILQKKSS